MSVTVHTATVYKTSARGRRYFSKRQAFIAEAISRMKKKYEPDGVDDRLIDGDHYQTVFYTGEQLEKFHLTAERYYRMFGRRRRKAAA